MDLRIDRQLAVSVAIAFAVGITFWPILFVAAIAIPALALRQRKRLHSMLVASSYYAGAAWLAIPAAKAFFGARAGIVDGAIIWSCGAALLSLPYAILWTSKCQFTGLRAMAAVLMSVPPPLGIIGIASPITAAGLLFPGTAWFGLLATLAAIAALAIRPATAALGIAATATICNVVYPGTQKLPLQWEAVNTNFGDVGRAASAELEAANAIQQRALCSPARVIIFPETVVPRWTEATELFWQPTLYTLARSGKTVLIGTTLDLVGKAGYENGVIIRGAQTGTFLQRIPIPIGMWNPLRPSSARLHVAGPTSVKIDGRRTAILLCYEQLLTWPILTAMTSNPEVLIGVSNAYWTKRTRNADLQQAGLSIWARLNTSRLLCARNL